MNRLLRLPTIVRYSCAPIATGMAFWVQWTLLPQPGIAPFVFFFFSVALTACLGGRIPGLIAVALSAALANYAFVGPFGTWETSGPGFTAMLLFLVSASAVSLLCSAFRGATLRSASAAEVASQQVRLVDLSQDAILVWQLGGNIESWNFGAEALYGFAEAEAIGRSSHRLLQARLPLPWPQLQAELERQTRWEGELEHTTKDGRRVRVWSRLQVLRGRDGVVRVLESNRDITERTRLEAALRGSEERLRAIFENAALGILETDGLDRFAIVNPRLCQMLGYQRHELIGKSAVDDLTAPEDRELSRRLNAELARGTRERLDYEKRYLRRDGSLLWVHVTLSAIRDGLGRYLYSVGTVQDIGERKAAQGRLAYLASFPEQSPNPIVEADESGRVTYANPAALRQLPDVREVGKAHPWLSDWDTVVALSRKATADAPAERTLAVGERVFHQVVGRTPDAGGVRTYGLDITELKRVEGALRVANERLEDADRRKDEFLAVLSHELRNPLTPIRNSVYLLNRAAGLDERGRRAAAVIDRQTGMLSRLIDDLLDVTRIARGKIRLQRSRVDLVQLVQQVVEDGRPAIVSHQLQLELRLHEVPIWVEVDSARIAQAVGNLVHNATKFTPAGGTVGVAVSRDDRGLAVVEVQDSGVGIDRQTLARLFQPFTQADRSLDRSRGGLGLGLALTKGLVELHGGDIQATSAGPGRGAQLTLRLPLAEAEAAAAAAGAVSGRGRFGGRCVPPCTVLIVEDNRDSADSLREVLELAGHQVAVAYDGREGVERARRLKPALILCDLGLPELDGYAVARAIRADAQVASTFLVALTGYAQPEDVQRSREAGFDRHLAKPPDLEELEAVLLECLGAGASPVPSGMCRP